MADAAAPITLLGIGRSGTSLIERLFNAIPTCVSAGETASMITGIYTGVDDAYFDSPILPNHDRETRPAQAVRFFMQEVFQLDLAEHWFHKPAGIPKRFDWNYYRHHEDRMRFPSLYYRELFDRTFPDARYFTVLRNPWDIIASRMKYSGWPETGQWNDIAIVYDILDRFRDKLELVLFYEDIKENPREEMMRLLSHFHLDSPPDFENLLQTHHAPAKDSELHQSHQESWKDMQGPDDFSADTIALIERFWKEAGKTFTQPGHNRIFFT